MRYIRDFTPLKEEQLDEAKFKAGTSKVVAEKVANVLSRKIGKKIGLSTLPVPYSVKNETGKRDFLGYIGEMKDGSGLMINFLLNGSDEVYSISYYKDFTRLDSSYEINLKGHNIVKVIEVIASVLTGEYFNEYLESTELTQANLKEARRTVAEMIGYWLEEDHNALSEIDSGNPNYQKLAQSFINFIRTNNLSSKQSIGVGSFQAHLATALQMNPSLKVNANKVPTVQVQNGGHEQLIDDPDAAKIFAEAINPRPAQIMEDMADAIRQIAKNNPFYTGALVYGKAGVGKTETVLNVLRDEGAPFTPFDTPIGGYTGFMGILYKFKDDKILVFDDNDSIFDDDKAINLLKKMLERKPVRTVNVSTPIKVRASGEIIPAGSFDFTSSIIFISNKKTMDQAIVSRLTGAVFAIDFTNEEVVELIRDNLDNIWAEYPEITTSMKQECLDFCEKIVKAIKDIDFRRFQAILAARLASDRVGDNSKWKKRAVQILMTAPKEK